MGQAQSSLEDFPLVKSAFSGDANEVRRLITEGESPVQTISLKGYGQISPVMAAIHNNHLECTRICLENMSQSETQIRYGTKKMSALHLACSKGCDEICEAVIAKGGDLRLPDADGNTALLSAVYGGNLSTVWVIAEKARLCGLEDYIDETNDNNQTALHVACSKGNLAVVSCLLKEGADGNKPMRNLRKKQTPVEMATLAGHADVVEALLTAGSSVHVDTEDRRGLTLLHRAVLNNHPKIVRLLIEHGVHLETGHTQLGDPSENQEYSEEYPTPALVAAAFGRSECLKAILEGPPGDVKMVLDKPGRLDFVAVVIERLQGIGVPETAETPVAWATQFPCKYFEKSVKVMGVGPQVEFMSSCKHMEVEHVECANLLMRAGSGVTPDQLSILEDNIRRLRQEGCSGQALTSARDALVRL